MTTYSLKSLHSKRYLSPLHYLPATINWLLKKREEEIEKRALVNGINLNILLSLTSVVEFVTKKAVEVTLLGSFDPLKITVPLQNAVMDYLNIIEKGTYSKVNEFFEKVLDVDRRDYLGPEIYESINTLFQIRNLLVHGNAIEINEWKHSRGSDIDNFENLEELSIEIEWQSEKLKRIAQYLSKKVYGKKLKTEDYTTNYFLQNEVIGFFIEHVIQYVRKMSQVNDSFKQYCEKDINLRNFEIVLD